MSLAIRPATPDDAPLIGDLIRELAVYERLEQEAVATVDDLRRALFGPAPRVFCDIAQVDGEAVGFALWFYNFSTFAGRHGIYLEDLYVRPDARGVGAGRALLAGLARRCVDQGLARLEWAVLDWNAPAIGFYQALGAVALDAWTVNRLTGDALARLRGMSAVAYVNGRYVRRAAAAVNVEDRGLQFADAVYEVWAVLDGRLADCAGHLARLSRSLAELRIAAPMSDAALMAVLRETVRANRVRDGLVYLQVTRGVAPRDHAFPRAATPGVIVTAKRIDLAAEAAKAERGVRVVTTPEARWARCDIKTTGLLPNVLAKQAAREAGAYEAWFVDADGFVTEGASTNAWIVTPAGVLVTREAEANILRGVTRTGVLALADDLQIRVEQRAFTVAEAKGAAEALITAASTFAMPVVAVDGHPIGDGAPGPVVRRLRSLYLERARATAV